MIGKKPISQEIIMKNRIIQTLSLLLVLCIVFSLCGCDTSGIVENTKNDDTTGAQSSIVGNETNSSETTEERKGAA